MLLEKVNRNPALAGHIAHGPAQYAAAPVMATFTAHTVAIPAVTDPVVITTNPAKVVGVITGGYVIAAVVNE